MGSPVFLDDMYAIFKLAIQTYLLIAETEIGKNRTEKRNGWKVLFLK